MEQRQHADVVLIHPNQRKKKTVPDNPVTYEVLSPENCESLAMFSVTATPGQSTGPNVLQHGGDENLLVVTGTCEIEVEGQKYTLGPGDSAFIPRGRRHRLTNVGTETVKCVFVISPPVY